MKYPLSSLLLCLPLLAACQRTPEPAAPAQDASAAQADAAPTDAEVAGADQPSGDVPPATAPPGTLPPRLQQGGQVLARWDGYGDVRLGMTAEQVRQAWGGQLEGAPDAANGPDACYYLRPKWAVQDRSFGFMMEGGKLVRYDSENPKELAPGGGRAGMPEADITTLYAGHVDTQPHKYEQGAHVLRVTQDGQAGVLVFETDASGKVTRWRVGLPPQVDYVEGCG
ncbi:lectin [Stenotrophomonas sp. HITSZ_GD]|uniref:lectin n=1 Tax=Stenotrophomonas sp. HITSZ_GD TaxID=3037248 RepID=UPI00240D48B5|nr:lectin [Stenotrophomonas sp. HITSZ_GD]MDG2526065.1 lectin [Stenotrophomonas sp. HITSZ_GD]